MTLIVEKVMLTSTSGASLPIVSGHRRRVLTSHMSGIRPLRTAKAAVPVRAGKSLNDTLFSVFCCIFDCNSIDSTFELVVHLLELLLRQDLFLVGSHKFCVPVSQ